MYSAIRGFVAIYEMGILYQRIQGNISFAIPALTKETAYRMELLGNTTAEDGETQEKVLYRLFFRTSHYDRFMDKIADFNTRATRTNEGGVLVRSGPMKESFDQIELNGLGDISPLVSFSIETFNDGLTPIQDAYEAIKATGYTPPPGSDFGLGKAKLLTIHPAPGGIMTAATFGGGSGGGGTTTMVLRNFTFAKAQSDFTQFQNYASEQILSECLDDCKDDLSTNPMPRCSCSWLSKRIRQNTTAQSIYNNPTRAVPPGSYPAYASYRLPGLREYSTRGAPIEF